MQAPLRPIIVGAKMDQALCRLLHKIGISRDGDVVLLFSPGLRLGFPRSPVPDALLSSLDSVQTDGECWLALFVVDCLKRSLVFDEDREEVPRVEERVSMGLDVEKPSPSSRDTPKSTRLPFNLLRSRAHRNFKPFAE
jgi:hypothetical protein